ncbi:MAG: RraA family protein [Pseudomonadota bacterium]
MIEDPPRLTVKRNRKRPTEAQLAAFQNTPTGFVGDAMAGQGVLATAISPLRPDALTGPVCGPAFTVHAGAADILAGFAALPLVQPGDFFVIAFDEHQKCATVGDRMCGMLANNGVIGLVTDGPVRDIDGIAATGVPVWCTGLTPATPFTQGPGTIGLPIQVGGQRVDTGDIVVADRDGVVVVPFDEIDRVATALMGIRRLETDLDAEVADGLRSPSWAGEVLRGPHTRWVD